ncbi:hypothetical protein N7510_000496 [Penicillium lagena]|uniref:uncharacterized protein n=1 Tax=Penicillium lagena TaxID=94218 RepID=UPI0025416EF1|nr:uncharacterized protein N7510_000496 [Penicillium lagena]KAJ5624187.1 hypothetical protein N7510_000496 [Penicillium lagena]
MASVKSSVTHEELLALTFHSGGGGTDQQCQQRPWPANQQQCSLTIEQKEDFSFRGSVGIQLGQAPYIASELFVGRGYELDEIAKALHPDHKAQKQRRLVLGGMGGIGKTQLAIAYAESARESYSSVFWLNAVSEAALKDSFRLIASFVFDIHDPRVLEDKEIVRRVHQWLSTPNNTGWLLIFDSYEDSDQFLIDDYYPLASHGAIVVTTRRPDLVAGSTIDIKPLQNIKDSLAILQTRSKRENRLAKRLAGLPLALATAGTYLHRSTFTFERYLQEYEKRWNVDPRRTRKLQEYQERTLYTTWDLSYSRLEKEDPDAAKLLKLLAYFDNQSLWYGLFHAGLTDSSPEWLREVLIDDVNFNGVMEVLVEYYFLDTHQTSDSWSMHNCVHDWTLVILNKDIDAKNYWYAFDCVSASIKDDSTDDFANLSYSPLAAHATRLVQQRLCQNDVIYDIAPRRLDQASLIANLLRHQVLLLAAEKMYQRALAGHEKALGPPIDPRHCQQSQGRLDQAEQMYQRALAGREKALGANHPSTLITVNNLGVLYWTKGRLDQAEQMYQLALAGREKALGADHPSTINTVNNLAVLYRDQGKLDQAQRMHQRSGQQIILLSYEQPRTLRPTASRFIYNRRLYQAKPIHFPPLLSRERAHIRNGIYAQWQSEWRESRNGSHLRKIDNALPAKYTRQLYGNLPRNQVYLLTQLRTGHCWLSTYAKLFRHRDDDRCVCGARESVIHVLLDCPALRHLRRELQEKVGDAFNNISTLLGEGGPRGGDTASRAKILDFAKASQRFQSRAPRRQQSKITAKRPRQAPTRL